MTVELPWSEATEQSLLGAVLISGNRTSSTAGTGSSPMAPRLSRMARSHPSSHTPAQPRKPDCRSHIPRSSTELGRSGTAHSTERLPHLGLHLAALLQGLSKLGQAAVRAVVGAYGEGSTRFEIPASAIPALGGLN